MNIINRLHYDIVTTPKPLSYYNVRLLVYHITLFNAYYHTKIII